MFSRSSLLLLLLLIIINHAVAALNVTELDCRIRLLAFQFAQKLQPWRHAQHQKLVWDALRLTEMCHKTEPPLGVETGQSNSRSSSHNLPSFCHHNHRCFFVDPTSVRPFDGSMHYPFLSVHDALEASRSSSPSKKNIIVFRQGIHTLNDRTLTLDERDDFLTLRSFPGEHATISGGMHVPHHLFRQNNQDMPNVWTADLSKLLSVKKLPKVASLFTSRKRLYRARYPNSNPELNQWGYASPHKLNYSFAPDETVLEWRRPATGKAPNFIYQDFTTSSSYFKNDSTMLGYNIYASGKGGVCADLWGNEANSYWCSNASAGGWAEVDRECATTGRLQIPIGMSYNRSHEVGMRLDSWTGGAIGGILHAWHSQSWAMHMFEIADSAAPGSFNFTKGGGRQGGRNWCRCDQCTYAGGSFCRQHATPPDDSDDRLISGTWMIENVLEELDVPGEFYFDPLTKYLFLYPNSTVPPRDLRFALLETLISIKNARNIVIHGLTFRDAAPTYMSDWSAPSGGDWSLHRGGAIFMEKVDHVEISNNTFSRLDGNAVFLSGYTRHVTIRGNIFEWLGENAVATWGRTKDWDATSETQPMRTIIEDNIMRELGIYQKQSSAVGLNKAALTTIRNNLMFNMPRAAINFNDMMGGGDVVTKNLIVNTCRESGDHGPINSWDRQPFLTTLKSNGKMASFEPLMREIAHNFIFANYGASEGVDNDDGSSWYHIHHNVFYDSEGFKMDYGGHDSIYEFNLVVSYPATYSQNCIGFGSFYKHHGHIVRNNKCIVPFSDKRLVFLDECDGSKVTIADNEYYSPNGTALYQCGYQDEDKLWKLSEVQERYQLELGSSANPTPKVETIVGWSKKLLLLPPVPELAEEITSRIQ